MKSAPTNKLAIIFVFVTVLIDMVGFGLIIPVEPALIKEVGHLDVAHASLIGGWLFAAFSVTQFLFGPAMGNLSDAFGRRPLLLLAVAGLGVDYTLMALAPHLAWLFVGRLLAGFCGASYVVANAFIADITAPEDRAKAFGLMGAAFGLGFVIGPAVGGLLGSFGTRVPFFVAAGVSVVNLAFGYFVLPETLSAEKRRPFAWSRANPFSTFKVFQTYKGVVPLCGVMFLYFMALSIYPAIWPFWGMAKFGWNAAMIGGILAAFGVINAVFQGGLTGIALKIFGDWNVALIGLVFALISALGFALAVNLSMVLVLLFINGPEAFVQPTLTAMMSKEVPDDAQGEMQGGIASIQSLGMLIGTILFSQIFGYFLLPTSVVVSPNIAFFIAVAVLAIALGLFLVTARSQQKEKTI